MKKILYFALLLLVVISSCKKSDKVSPNGTGTLTGPSKTGSTLDLIKDSVYLYTKEEYLWYDQLPTYAKFQPRSFTNAEDATALTDEVNALSQYAINPATNKPYEYYTDDPGQAKYSFIDDGAVAAELNGKKGDFGFYALHNLPDVNDLRVIFVYPGSPADIAGIKRGYRITSINGNTKISYDGDNTSTPNLNFIDNSISNSNTIALVLTKPDGTTMNVNMDVANYTLNPVFMHEVLDEGAGKKIGYMVFSNFTTTDNAGPQLDAAFSDFTSQGITDLVIDLRYNGGGYVETAEYLDDLIVPSASSGSPMYTAYYNNNLQADKAPLIKALYNIPAGYFKPTYPLNHATFEKNGSLNIKRVFFIITNNTASASELTINNLRPYMDVEFVGSTSYGKPVGFFKIDINKYQLYTPEFYTQNSANQGGYYNGFTPGATGYPGKFAYDDVTKDFGDPTEGLLSLAINDVKNGTYNISTPVVQSVGAGRSLVSLNQLKISSSKMNQHKFMGMVRKNTLTLKRKIR